jgi:hypothetical protein
MNGYLPLSMAQGGKKMMARRWRGMQERLDVRDALDQSYSMVSWLLQ